MGKKILLADDSLTIQKVVELTLSGTGYELTCVSDGRKAIESLAASRPDLILADVVMPEKNGYEVCEAVKGNPATARIPVILLAGTFEPFDRERANRVGNDMVITKPFDAHQLVERIDALLARPPAPPAAAAPEQIPAPGEEAPAPREVEVPFETVSMDDTLPVSGHTAAPTEVNPFGPDHDFKFSARPENRELESAAPAPWRFPESEPSRQAAPTPSEEAPAEQPASEPPAMLGHHDSPVEEISERDAEILFDVPFETGPLTPADAAPSVAELTEAQIDAIAARVVQKLSDRVVREIAWDVVPDLAERAVKRRIEELESGPE